MNTTSKVVEIKLIYWSVKLLFCRTGARQNFRGRRRLSLRTRASCSTVPEIDLRGPSFARQRRHKSTPAVEAQKQVRRFVYKLSVINATTVCGTVGDGFKTLLTGRLYDEIEGKKFMFFI